MKSFKTYAAVTVLFCGSLWAQTELTISKFRFTRYEASQFERLVIEFTGPSVTNEVEIKKSDKESQKDVTLVLKNLSLTGNIPESNMNASYRDKKKWIGPLSFNMDPAQKNVSIRTMLGSLDNELDAFWLNEPTRLVIDVYPKGSPRARSREMEPVERKTASVSKPVPKIAPTAPSNKPKEEQVFCFRSSSEINPQISFQPFTGDSSISMKADNPPAPSDKAVDYIRCYPAQARVIPQVFFNSGASPLFMPPMQPGEGRNISSEMGAPKSADQPPSLNGKIEPKKGADPAKLLPPIE